MSIIYDDLCEDNLTNDWIGLVIDTFRRREENIKSGLSIPRRYLALNSHIEVETGPFAQLFQFSLISAHLVIDKSAELSK